MIGTSEVPQFIRFSKLNGFEKFGKNNQSNPPRNDKTSING